MQKSGLWDISSGIIKPSNNEGSGNAMDYTMVWVRGHVEVYDWAGRFCFSADNEREAQEELALTA